MSVCRLFSSALFAIALVIATTTAHAAPSEAHRARAKEAYARGVSAHDAGDYGAAAAAFAEADAYAPSPVALMAALDAAVEADDPVLGAELLERSRREPPTPALAASIDAARAKLGGRAGRVRVACPAGARCASTIDGRAASGDATWVSAGRHTVSVRVDDSAREHVIEVRAGETVVLSPTEAPPPPENTRPTDEPSSAEAPAERSMPASPERRGLSPVVFFIGAAVTVGLGAGSAAAGLLAKGKHDDFVSRGCDDGPGPGCDQLKRDGEPLVLATNVLLAGAAVTAIATTVIGLVFTDWKGHPSDGPLRVHRVTASPLPSGGAAGSLSIAF